MKPEIRISAFSALGRHLRDLPAEERAHLARQAANKNPWFDEPNVALALDGISALLEERALREWLSRYELKEGPPKKVGVIMAGNIPMVGFHDLLCVLLSSHHLYARLSSDDQVLMRYLVETLISIEPAFAERIQFVELLKEADAIIATGSDNTSRYFEYYFARRPHIIRRNRTSVAILHGQETKEELRSLGQDILQYYGLGCRNVSKAYVPVGFAFEPFFEAIEERSGVIDHHKYRNNYDYQRSILLVNKVPHLDNGFLSVTQSPELVSPISVLYYDTYLKQQELETKLAAFPDKIQAVVSARGWYPGSVPFGQTQCPTVSDYADGVDTMAFLLGLR